MVNRDEIKYSRDNTRIVNVGDVAIGGSNPISVQSMAKIATTDVTGVLDQIERAHRAGCDIFRVSVPDMDSAKSLAEIVKNSPIPIVADIHFDYKLALASLESNVHKLRINPGNIGSAERVKIVANEAMSRDVPIRIGVNAGSLPKDILRKYGKPCADALVESAEREIFILREIGFENIVISMKSSSPMMTLEANMKFSQKYDYPLHIGVTESGFGMQGIVASTVGMTMILSAGIGNTIRVSLTEPPENEVRAAREILRFLDLRRYWVRLISCPTCARCKVDLPDIANRVWDGVKDIKKDIEIAVMCCIVNGPGEASDADIGVACGKNVGLIFKNGKEIAKVNYNEIVSVLLDEIGNLE
ncbi:flavodoxin-dependent (E)-4-hydroxy-3-methylbut-2-enyl-diphosphate synthase [bacterium]|nr:flavodoxin-dependent (E)-4-hydroxy-3-methylbut-2-enyl-diphosphate synthase [bacterium]